MAVPSRKGSCLRGSPILVLALALFCLLPAFLAIALPPDPSQLSRRSIEVEGSSDSLQSSTVVRRLIKDEKFQRPKLHEEAWIKKIPTAHEKSQWYCQFQIKDRAISLGSSDETNDNPLEKDLGRGLEKGLEWKNPKWKMGPLTNKPTGVVKHITAKRLDLLPGIFWASLSSPASPAPAIAPADLFRYGKGDKKSIAFLPNYQGTLGDVFEGITKHELISLIFSLAMGVKTMHEHKIAHRELSMDLVGIEHHSSEDCSGSLIIDKAEWLGSNSMTDEAESTPDSSSPSKAYYKSPGECPVREFKCSTRPLTARHVEAIQSGKKSKNQSLDVWSLSVMLWVLLLKDVYYLDHTGLLRDWVSKGNAKEKRQLLKQFEGKYTRSMTDFMDKNFQLEDNRPTIIDFIRGLRQTDDFKEAKMKIPTLAEQDKLYEGGHG